MNTTSKLYINGKFLVQRTTGVQRFARGLVSALDELLASQPELPAPILLTPPGADFLPLRKIEQRICGSSNMPATLWEQSSLPWAARRGTLLCLAGSAPLLGGARIPTIHDAAVFLHPQAYSRRFVAWYRLLFRVVTAGAPVSFSVSDHAANELEQKLSGRKFRVVPNAAEHILNQSADNNILKSHKLDSQRYLLAVGSRNPTKNLEALIAAYSDSGLGPDISLVLVGGGNGNVFSGSEPVQSVPGIVRTGAIGDAELRALYENALALVFPSTYEGFGIPPLEAMSCNCPVVASNASSIPEVCGDAAVYFDPYDKQSMIKALMSIVMEEGLREDLIRKGRARLQLYSWKRSAAILLLNLQAIGLLDPIGRSDLQYPIQS